MINQLKKIVHLFTTSERKSQIKLFIILFIGSLFELMGVSILLPFMEVLTDIEKFKSYQVVKYFVNRFDINYDTQLIIIMILVVILIYMIKNLFLCFALYYQSKVTYDCRLELETRVMRGYIYEPLSFHNQHNSAEMQRTILQDVSAVLEAMAIIFTLLADFFTTVLVVIFLVIQAPIMTFSLSCLLILFLILYIKVFKNRLYQYGKISLKHGERVINCVKQSLIGIKDVKVNEAEDFFVSAFHKDRKIQSDIAVKTKFIQQLSKYLLETIFIAGILLYILFGILLGVNVAEIIPQLMVFAMAVYKVLPAANRINVNVASFFSQKASVDVVYNAVIEAERLSEEKLNISKEENVKIKIEAEGNHRDIHFQNVSFSYENSDKKILDHVNLLIGGGKSTAFKGESGAGKTTAIDLLLGLLEPTEGKIFFDNIDIAFLGKEWRKFIGYVPQNVYLNDDTIKSNIAFGIEHPNEERIWTVLQEAQLREYVESLPEKLNTRVGESGMRISGGQRQRLGIARALYKNPEILVFDEATSALDAKTEEAVMESINYLHGKKTIIIIAHRLSTIEKCDKIYEVIDGTIRTATKDNNNG